MTNEKVRMLQDRKARDEAMARWLWVHVGKTILGVILLPAVWLDYQASRELIERGSRDFNGNLAEGSGFGISAAAVIFCVVTLVASHWLFKRMSLRPRGGALVIALVIVSLMILAPQFINVITDVRIGNSLDLSVDQGMSLQNWVLTAAGGMRALTILLGAFVATGGLFLIERGIKDTWIARRRGKDAKVIARVIQMIDDGYREAEALKNSAIAYNSDRARQFAIAFTDGLRETSRMLTRYLKASSDPFVNADQWVQEVGEQFTPPYKPTDPAISDMVAQRLKQHAIDLDLLPIAPETLSPAARRHLATLADWLREQADADTVYNATVMRLEAENA